MEAKEDVLNSARAALETLRECDRFADAAARSSEITNCAEGTARSLEALGITPEEIGMDEAVAETENGFNGLEEDWAARRVALAKAFLLAIAAVDTKTAGYIAGDPLYAWAR